LYIF
jgi:hypothetical protein